MSATGPAYEGCDNRPVRVIPDPGFSEDDGAVPADVARALASYSRDPGAHSAALAVLQQARLLVPVVAVPGEVEYDERGVAHDKTSDMATVLIRARSGRTGLLAFTGAEPMARWDPAARPVPVSAPRAAQAARQDGADALLVDFAGPTMFVVEGEDLTALAAGETLVRVNDRYGWARPGR
jgi:hypothetical protein